MNTGTVNSEAMPASAVKKIHVVIVDDHPLVREGLRARLARQSGMEVCGEAATMTEALMLIRATQPQLVIVDLALKQGHGLDLIKRIRLERHPAKILVMSAYPETLFAERALRAGAQGYISKDALQEHVIDAIHAVLRGEPFLSAAMSKRLMAQVLTPHNKRRGLESLTDREMQIFELIGQGVSTSEIAARLTLSVHTIETHREKIRHKLHLRNGTELVVRAVEWQLNHSATDDHADS